MAATRHVGIDLGGTNIKWTVMERRPDGWVTLDRGQVATRDAGPAAVTPQLAEVAVAASGRWPSIASVGIGVPGSYRPETGETRFLTNLTGDWDGVPVAASVERASGVRTFLINDARAFGVAELRMGAGRGAECMVGITLGTGIGGVVAVDGKIHHGHEGSAGELGHQIVEPDGPPCSCGGRGCLEALVNADRIAAAAGSGTVEEAADLARAGNARAQHALEVAGRFLGFGIANLVSVLTPDRIVIGGGISASLDLLLDPIWSVLRERVHLTPLDQLEIVPAELGVWAGAIGAAIHGAESTPS